MENEVTDVLTLTSCGLAASTVRHLYLRGGAGVGSMTKIYGSRQRNGVCPAHYSVGSKNVARKVLQALELLKMIEKDPSGYVPHYQTFGSFGGLRTRVPMVSQTL